MRPVETPIDHFRRWREQCLGEVDAIDPYPAHGCGERVPLLTVCGPSPKTTEIELARQKNLQEARAMGSRLVVHRSRDPAAHRDGL